PGMYIGGTGSDGLMHLVWELIDNGVDEAAAGFAKRVDVFLHRDGSVEVADNGRGIPVDMHAKRKVSALEVVLTELHAGGKFGGGAYGSSGGLHGVGASVVNALSTKLVAEVDRDGTTWRLGFNERVAGKFTGARFKKTHELEKVKSISKTKTGTRVRFWPDRELFDPAAEIDFELICDRVRQACFLVPGMKMSVTDKRTGYDNVPFTYVSRGGLTDLVNELSIGNPVTKVISISGIDSFEEKVPIDGKMTMVKREVVVDIALLWNVGYESSITTFVNTIPTREGGTHLIGFERAMNRAVNDVLLSGYRKLTKLAKQGKDRATKDDVQEGLVAAIKVSFPEPQFRGQTKQELGTPAIQGIVYDIVKASMVEWFEGAGPKSHVNALRDKLATAVINKVASKQVLENKRKAASLGSTGMPDKLADCRKHGMDSELLIVEGDSAAGPAKAGRNSENMAILPLRGKVVNAGKATAKQVLDNAEAQALITAIGGGSGKDFDLDSVRYGRIIILCDADVDGSHIRCLLLTLIYHYMRPLLDSGRVYAAQPPLFSAKWRGETYYAFSDGELEALIIDKNVPREKFVRFKGLGEMDVDELAETTLDPETRILRRLTIDDAASAAEAANMFDVLMGNDVAQRRQFLLANSDLIDLETLDI
ncbi:MAG: ATP-binding protein, partial [Acidimicrobiales bacterium]